MYQIRPFLFYSLSLLSKKNTEILIKKLYNDKGIELNKKNF